MTRYPNQERLHGAREEFSKVHGIVVIPIIRKVTRYPNQERLHGAIAKNNESFMSTLSGMETDMNFDINMRLVVRGVSYVALGAALFLSGRYIGQNDRLEAVATLQAMTIKSMAPTAVAVADTPAPVAPVQEKDDAPEVKYYDVAEGDMLSLISLETYGSTRYYPYLAKINGLEYPYELQLGETLVLPVDIASMDPTEVEEAYQEAVITESLIALDALTLDEPSEYEVSLKEIVPDNPPSLSPLDSGEFFSPTMTARLP